MQSKLEVEILAADFSNAAHADAIVRLLSTFALDPGAGGTPLPDGVPERLVPAIDAMPGACVFLAQAEEEFVGIALCLTTFSSFFASRSFNLHDLFVLPEHHRRGVGQKLIERVAQEARDRGCCSLTLEVMEANAPARAAYAKLGFASPGGTTLRLKLALVAKA